MIYLYYVAVLLYRKEIIIDEGILSQIVRFMADNKEHRKILYDDTYQELLD